MNSSHQDRVNQPLQKIRFWAGYFLFISIISYAIYKTPADIFNVDIYWMTAGLLFIVLMFCIQSIQVYIFLGSHNIKYKLLWPALFTARKGILNTVMPAKTGSLVLVGMLTNHYDVKWYQYVKYSAVGAIIALVVSLLSVIWMLFGFIIFLLLVIVYFSSLHLVSRYYTRLYINRGIAMSVAAAFMYLSMIGIFWAMLNGLGYDASLLQASQYAVASNTLAQVSITPGNIGVRELVLGLISPYLSVPATVGVLAGGVFFVLRTIVYGLFMIILDRIIRNRSESGRVNN